MVKLARRTGTGGQRLALPAMVFAVIAALTTDAAAQTAPATADAPLVEMSAGYQLLNVTDDPGTTFPFGLAVDLAFNRGALGFVAEGGWSQRSEGEKPDDISFDFWHVGAGLRWSRRSSSRVRPYAQTLIGAAFHRVNGTIGGVDQRDATSHFMVQPGGGVTYAIENGMRIVGAIDYRRVFLDQATEGDSGLNEIRLLVGVRLSFR